jgi:hypothetical protein
VQCWLVKASHHQKTSYLKLSFADLTVLKTHEIRTGKSREFPTSRYLQKISNFDETIYNHIKILSGTHIPDD